MVDSQGTQTSTVIETGPAATDGREAAAGVVAQSIQTPFHQGAPASVGVPLFVVGSIALGMAFIGYTTSSIAALPIILAATGLGEVIACVWAIGLGETVAAGIYGVFAGFWLSYAALLLGLGHNWFLVLRGDLLHAETMFIISWLCIVGLLLLGTLRLPLVFSVLFVFVEVALALALASALDSGSANLLEGAGAAVFAFALCGAVIYLDTLMKALGGKGVPLGPPIMK
jgi:succinate-acetate transporter protein